VMRLSDELLGLAEAATAPLTARHREEVSAMNERIAQFGERGSGARALDERHKRETRRYRVDALRDGLAEMAASYRDAMVAGTMARHEAAAEAVTRIHQAIAALDRNPNEALLLQSLLWSLPPIVERHRTPTT
jgi:DNA polymerase-3 subunit delta'